MKVSIIVPARNAAETLAETLRSVSDQTFADWEVIVVDDGSTDDTVPIVEHVANTDSRIRLVRQKPAGVSQARNKGLDIARFDHVLFLDADDYIFPDHLARLTKLLMDDPQLDAGVCGWAHVTPSEEFVFEQCQGEQGDLFRAHAQYCYSLIHTYLIRRSVVEEAGGFDPAFDSCEDWDLFQRVARLGARFGRLPEVLAGYRMRAGSATSDVNRLLRDGLAVLKNGHGPDHRVGRQHPVYKDGLPEEELPLHAYGHACTCAGYFLGSGLSADSTLDLLPGPPPPAFKPIDAAQAIFVHAMVAAARPTAEWADVWRVAQPQLKLFLSALENRLARRGFARRTELIANYLLQQSTGNTKSLMHPGRLLTASDRMMSRLRDVRKFARRAAWSTFRSTPVFERPGLHIKRVRAAFFPAATENPETRFEALFTERPDPWRYDNAYDVTKARQSLELLPNVSNGYALEIGCAEGHMTRNLAPLVKHLVATDISKTALSRAARRCAAISNVEFRHIDFMAEPLEETFDLIVCSEVLYYYKDLKQLKRVARRLTASLNMGGHLLLTHANQVRDAPGCPGFDWGLPYGAKVIGEVFGQTKGLTTVREARALLYRIHLLQRSDTGQMDSKIEKLPMPDPLPHEIASQVYCGASRDIPILVYPRIASNGSSVQANVFEHQVRVLHARGYRVQSIDAWQRARDYATPIAGKTMHLVFDEPSKSLVSQAQPVLEELDFTATCILTVDPLRGKLVLPLKEEHSDLPTWQEIRGLQARGMKFGVRLQDEFWRHDYSIVDLIRCISRARRIVSEELAEPISLLRAPDAPLWSRRRQWIAGASGFDYVLLRGAVPAAAVPSDRLLALPIISVPTIRSTSDLLASLGMHLGEGRA